MITIQPTCRFCNRQFGPPLRSLTDHFVNDNQVYYEFKCQPCRATQYFGSSGKALHYLFWIGPYKLYFMIKPARFQLCNGDLGPIFGLDYHPKLTPQNTTEEKIKTLILFS